MGSMQLSEPPSAALGGQRGPALTLPSGTVGAPAALEHRGMRRHFLRYRATAVTLG